MAALNTEWSTDDPTVAGLLAIINDTPANTVERYELEAWLHTFQARMCWERVGLIRASQRDSARRRAVTRKTAARDRAHREAGD